MKSKLTAWYLSSTMGSLNCPDSAFSFDEHTALHRADICISNISATKPLEEKVKLFFFSPPPQRREVALALTSDIAESAIPHGTLSVIFNHCLDVEVSDKIDLAADLVFLLAADPSDLCYMELSRADGEEIKSWRSRDRIDILTRSLARTGSPRAKGRGITGSCG